MALSFSAIKDYEGCPRRYHEVKILKHYPRQETEATLWGGKVHEAAEHYVRDGKPFEFDFPGQETVQTLAKMSGVKHCEFEMAVNDKLEPVPFLDPSALVRGIADIVVVKGAKAFVGDYKTGSAKYPDVGQLELMALLVFAHYPEVESSHGALVFLAHDKMVEHITWREDQQELWAKWLGKIHRIEEARRTGVWNPRSSGLCPWCPVTSCEHWREKPKGR